LPSLINLGSRTALEFAGPESLVHGHPLSGYITFHINGMTIHLALVIPFNKKINELISLSDEKCDSLIKHYDQLHLLVIGEIL
jgi:hypothetical protein